MSKTLKHSYILPFTALFLYLRGSAPYLGQWDTFDYLKDIVTHSLSPLGVGRPVFIGYNVLLWESMRRMFHLEAVRVELVAMAAAVLFGVIGVLAFRRLAGRLLSGRAIPMAVLALAVSPLYAIYSGYVMTEVPMLALLIAAASVLWKIDDRTPVLRDVVGGILFGLAVGIREQALTLSAAFLWILCSRRREASVRIRSIVLFGLSAGTIIAVPVLLIWFHNPSGFTGRIRMWLQAIPLAPAQFWNNVQASLLYMVVICPGAWLALSAAALYRLINRYNKWTPTGCVAEEGVPIRPKRIPSHVWGILCCLVVPVAALWRDADVQIHPRYIIVVLPAVLILCTTLYCRWMPPRKGPLIWAMMQILVFGISLLIFSPWRENETQKIEFARQVKESIPGKGLIIAGNYSPILDYYRGIGLRPEWRILWSGWSWDANAVKSSISDAWTENVPVYLSIGPSAWSYYEYEYMELHFMLKDHKREQVVPSLFRIYP